MDFELGERLDISDCIPGAHELGSHLQWLTVQEAEYAVLFVPLGGWVEDSAEKVSNLLGRVLPQDAYEVKFDLKANVTDAGNTQYRSRADVGLPPLGYQELMALGRGVLTSMLMFRDDYAVSAFYAVAIDGNRQLCQYYSRLFERHEQTLREHELEPVSSDEGLGYAFYCQRSAADDVRAATA